MQSLIESFLKSSYTEKKPFVASENYAILFHKQQRFAHRDGRSSFLLMEVKKSYLSSICAVNMSNWKSGIR